MPKHPDIPPRGPKPGTTDRLGRVLGILAALAAGVMVAALGVRPITSDDLGYHLTYGEHFLKTRRIVQTNQFIYTHFDAKLLADEGNLGPGCRYNAETDTYHFVNANWLSQVILAQVHDWAGWTGPCILRAALLAGTFALVVAAMRGTCQTAGGSNTGVGFRVVQVPEPATPSLLTLGGCLALSRRRNRPKGGPSRCQL